MQEEQGLYMDCPQGSEQERSGSPSLLPQARRHKGESEKCGWVGGPFARCTVALINGPSDVAVRTHVLHLFEKTGCQRQADLMMLAAALSSPAGGSLFR
jgi:hypothetical protein